MLPLEVPSKEIQISLESLPPSDDSRDRRDPYR